VEVGGTEITVEMRGKRRGDIGKGSEETYNDADDDAHCRDNNASLPSSKVAKNACQRKKSGEEQERRWNRENAPMETCPRMVPTVKELLRRVDIALL
jgi:hypothetical protein